MTSKYVSSFIVVYIHTHTHMCQLFPQIPNISESGYPKHVEYYCENMAYQRLLLMMGRKH